MRRLTRRLAVALTIVLLGVPLLAPLGAAGPVGGPDASLPRHEEPGLRPVALPQQPAGPVDLGFSAPRKPLPPVLAGAQNASHVVIAVVDTGINPYHEFFRAPHLRDAPSTWLSGFPASAIPLNLTLNATSVQAGLAADAATWASVKTTKHTGGRTFETHLYTFPGTRVVGAVHFSEYYDLGERRTASNVKTPIYDDNGHGTHSAGLAAGADLPVADANVLIVMVEVGSEHFTAGVLWASQQPWIDAISLSAGSVANLPGGSDMSEATRHAAESGKPVFIASGNGFTNTGLTPDHCLTYTSGFTQPTWITRIGAAEPRSGNPTWWHCIPVDAIARTDVDSPSHNTLRSSTLAGGTSAATPNAAGHFAQLLLEARRAGVTASRHTVLQHLLNASEPASPSVGAFREPSNPVTSPIDQGYGLIDAAALDRARATLLTGQPPRERPDVDTWFRVDRTIRGGVKDPLGGANALFIDDAGTGTDAGNTFDRATPIAPGGPYHANLSVGDGGDWYAVEVAAGQALDVRLRGAAKLTLQLYDPAGQLVRSVESHGYGVEARVQATAAQSGAYRILATSLAPQHYRFSVQVDATAVDPLLG